LVGQDWGGPVAAGVGARSRTRVHGLVFANTAVLRPKRPFRTKAFHRLARVPLASDVLFRLGNFPIPFLDYVQGDRSTIGTQEKRAYRWPFERVRDRAGPLALARMVPNAETHPSTPTIDEVGAWVEGFMGPSALVWGTRDPILGRALTRHIELLPDAKVYESNAGHFLQEEVPDLVTGAIRGVLDAPSASAKSAVNS
ncbi:MAG: alpha/beta fold hydrolase, partial [Myxococcales bacterium]|nr:alpha/beta fold hydrolase [Myxococcales bacterium]